jgi:Pectate lyase superfamily protein
MKQGRTWPVLGRETRSGLLSILFATAGALALGTGAVHGQDSPIVVQSISALQAINTSTFTNDTIVYVIDYYPYSNNSSERGGGHFRWHTPYSILPSGAAPDGGRYIASSSYTNGLWERILEGSIPNVYMWGAHGNGATDDTTNLQNALNACLNWGNGTEPFIGELYFPAGRYLITNTLFFNATLTHIVGENQATTAIYMKSGCLADILQTGNAYNALHGLSYDFDHHLLVESIQLDFDPSNTNNAGLVVCQPGELNAIRNLDTEYGGIGVRCLGGGAPGLRMRDVHLDEPAVAGVSLEPVPGTSFASSDPISIIGISGDNESPVASMVLFSNSLTGGAISDIKAEGSWGGGILQYNYPNPTNVGTGQMVAVNLQDCSYNANGDYSSNLVTLKGSQITPTISLSRLHLFAVQNLINDEVSGRNVPADIDVFTGAAQQTAQLPLTYATSEDAENSELVVGQTVESFFYVTNTNWFRVMTAMNVGSTHVAGRLTLSQTGYESTEIQVDIDPNNSSAPWLNVTRCPQGAGQPVVTQARGFYYWNGSGYSAGVDVYVGNPLNSPYILANPKLGRMTAALDLNGYYLPAGIDSELIGNIQAVSATLPAGSTVTYTNTYR